MFAGASYLCCKHRLNHSGSQKDEVKVLWGAGSSSCLFGHVCVRSPLVTVGNASVSSKGLLLYLMVQQLRTHSCILMSCILNVEFQPESTNSTMMRWFSVEGFHLGSAQLQRRRLCVHRQIMR